MNEGWLAKVLDGGAHAGELHLRGTALEALRVILSALEGAMLVARAYRSVERFELSARRLLADLIAEPAPARATKRARSPR